MTLHLLDEAGLQAVPALCAHLRARVAEARGDRVLLFGGPRLSRMAQAGGLRPDAVLPVPLGRPWLAPAAARRAVAGFAPREINAWSVDALALARWLFPGIPASLTLLQGPTRGEAVFLRSLGKFRPFVFSKTSSDVGAPLGAVAPAEPFPGSSAAVALVGLRCDAWRALSAMGIFNVIRGFPPAAPSAHRLWVHPRQTGLAHAKRQAAGLGRPDRLRVTGAVLAPWTLPADMPLLVLASSRGPDATQTVALPALAAQGRNIVAEDDPALQALLGGAAGVRFAPGGDVPALADALAQVVSAGCSAS